jgi:cell division protein FtsL
MPVLKLRFVVIGSLVVMAAIAGPLLMIRKQVYVRNLAIRREQLADSLSVYSREAARLTIVAKQLSSPQRLEQIARDKLGMEYPSSAQITIVQPRAPSKARFLDAAGFFAFLRRSLAQSRG